MEKIAMKHDGLNWSLQCPKCKATAMLGTVGICDEKNLGLALIGKDPNVKHVIECGACDFRSKEYDSYNEMEDELSGYYIKK